MEHKYLPHTSDDVRSMLQTLRLTSLDDLFRHIPYSGDTAETYKLPIAVSESELRAELGKTPGRPLISFCGFGAYEHERPAIIDALSSRQEFLTSYTPYQPEVAQGTLQYIFEFQSIVCELTGMDVSNASMYDGATAAAEAMMMAVNITGIPRVLVSDGLLPHVLEVLKTYAHFREVALETIPSVDGQLDMRAAQTLCATPAAAVIVAYPNRYGIIDRFAPLATIAHEKKSLLIAYADLMALSVFQTPRAFGADIVTGEAQSLGIPLSYGGPYLGYLATITPYIRKMPGRICGMTKDNRGQRAFVLTLQAREQHIRRDKANSNICSNQSLMALQATIYAAALGKTGLIQVAHNAINATHYLADKLLATKRFHLAFKAPFGYEVTLRFEGDLAALNKQLLRRGYLGGRALEHDLCVFYASEMKTKVMIDEFVTVVAEVAHELR